MLTPVVSFLSSLLQPTSFLVACAVFVLAVMAARSAWGRKSLPVLRLMLLLPVTANLVASGWFFAQGLAGKGYISLRRSACFGGCPVYQVTLYQTGDVVFEGFAHVRRAGVARKQLGPAAFRKLADELDSGGYFQLNGGDGSDVRTDFPSATTSVLIGGRHKTIRHDFGDESAPKRLSELEARIDEAAGTKEWTE